ncbi:hypothetical protein LQ953_14965 [Sphingomonas sp. IC-56]|uniref:hypothetical protein n=1 Tax=Sphingomonas sp. IC-56 TaxID=2898529 RepID=UPI001E2E0559|nr:hypothetical protein [Sphingomonas sp. IC-56]MCD2325321.1 hypothetical protein [Sphingomonas sp. IC-56]
MPGGGQGHPLLETYAQLLDVQITDQLACQRALADDLARVLRECGEAAGATIVVTQPGASPRDIHRALAETEEVHSATGAMLRRLKSFLPFGAGPNAAKAGGAHV